MESLPSTTPLPLNCTQRMASPSSQNRCALDGFVNSLYRTFGNLYIRSQAAAINFLWRVSYLYATLAAATNRYGGQVGTTGGACVNCSQEVAAAEGLTANLLGKTYPQVISSSQSGIFNVTFGEAVPASHYAVKVGEKIVDRNILGNIASYNQGVIPSGFNSLQNVDTFSVESYTLLRQALLHVMGGGRLW